MTTTTSFREGKGCQTHFSSGAAWSKSILQDFGIQTAVPFPGKICATKVNRFTSSQCQENTVKSNFNPPGDHPAGTNRPLRIGSGGFLLISRPFRGGAISRKNLRHKSQHVRIKSSTSRKYGKKQL